MIGVSELTRRTWLPERAHQTSWRLPPGAGGKFDDVNAVAGDSGQEGDMGPHFKGKSRTQAHLLIDCAPCSAGPCQSYRRLRVELS